MFSHLIFDAILPNLTADQINELALCNRQLRSHIDRNRLDLPRTIAYDVHLISLQRGYKIKIGFKNEEDGVTKMSSASREILQDECSDNKKSFGEDVMKYLKYVQVENLFLHNDELCHFLDEKWMKSIKDITITGRFDEKKLPDLLSRANCSSIAVHECYNGINADTVLDKMPFVKSFCLNRAICCPKFLYDLTEKSKLGSGMGEFSIHNLESCSFNLQSVIEFLKNASFASQSRVFLNYISCTVADFQREMKSLEQLPGWSLIDKNRDFFIIQSPSSTIYLSVIHFTNQLM